jgi:hypothetical protein
MNTSF